MSAAKTCAETRSPAREYAHAIAMALSAELHPYCFKHEDLLQLAAISKKRSDQYNRKSSARRAGRIWLSKRAVEWNERATLIRELARRFMEA